MKFYEKYFKNCYEELLTYYPDFYKNVYEMVEILKAFGSLSDDLEAAVEQTYLNNFILTADDRTIKIWETVLHITYKEKLSLEQRKRVVIGFVSGGKHIGEREIRELISTYTSNLKSIDFKNGVVKIEVDGEIFDEENLLNTLLHRIPAHLKLAMTVRVKRIIRGTLEMYGISRMRMRLRASPVPVKHADTAIAESVGGTFCYTRTQSKLIG